MATKPNNEAVHPNIAEQMALDREQRRNERQSLVAIAAADVTTAALRTTFLPQSMGEALQFAQLMSDSNFVPGHLRGKPGDCMAVVMISSRWGMDPFAVANKTYFVKDGAPAAFEAQLVNAVVNGSHALSGRLRVEWEGDGEKLRCTVRGFLRADPDDEKVRTQSIARITTRNSPLWKTDPEQQLAYYTTRAWAKLYCPEVLLGVVTPDDIDIDPERARVVSPPMPRRSDIPEIGGGRGEEDEETARRLDAETFVQREGRDDANMGEANNGTSDIADKLIARIEAAAIIGDVIGIEGEYQTAGRDMMEVVDQDRVETAIGAAKAKFKGGSK